VAQDTRAVGCISHEGQEKEEQSKTWKLSAVVDHRILISQPSHDFS
jgi:hypothetical protein